MFISFNLHFMQVFMMIFIVSLHDFIIINMMKSKGFSKPKPQRFNERQLFPSISLKVVSVPSQVFPQIGQKVQMPISEHQLQEQMRIYEWRVKTQFPIVKICDYKILRKQRGRSIVSVTTNKYPIKIGELSDVPLFKVLYLMKESIIGLERLFYKFGPFLVTASMIALNSQSKCKIWLSENFASNVFLACQMQEGQFLQNVYEIFLEISNKLKNTINFFKEMNQMSTFCQALNFIENYARQNKISIPNSCKIAQRQVKIVQSKSNACFNPSLTMTRAPKFLNSNNLRSSLKSSSKQQIENVIKPSIVKLQLENTMGNTMQLAETVQMKTLGDTAADIYGSYSMNSIQEQKETFDESIIFGQFQKNVLFKIPQSPLTFSNIGKKQLLATKNMNQNMDMNSFCQSIQFSVKFNGNPIQNFKSCRQIQTQQDENMQVSTRHLANIFQKNKWEKTLCGLFSQANYDMKKSTQHGVQKHRTSNSQKRLFLLQTVSKDLHESFMNDDSIH